MSLRTGATNFYYYDRPADQITNKTYPPGQKIWTQLPPDIAKIRIGAILAFTGIFFLAVLNTPSIREWRWLVVIVGVTLAAWVAYKHLLTKDPMVEAFYKIAGGKDNYDTLPEWRLEKNKKTYANFDVLWADADVKPLYRFSTSDGRKGLMVKGLSHTKEHSLVRIKGTGPARTQALMVFVEKLGPYDIHILIKNMTERSFSIINALNFEAWNNPFSEVLLAGEGESDDGSSSRTINGLYAYMSTDWANDFIAQRGVVNQLEPKSLSVKQV
ncbi:MAG TPA: hypothetical protein VFU89_08035 [Rhabdochlamydiaceae bacterium]|nr:hypothetical protein [Rhabdochlamydiaceae bacterium]